MTPRQHFTFAAAAALLGILGVAIAQMTMSRGIGTSVTAPPSVRYGSMGYRSQTQLMPSEARNVRMASGLMPSEMRDIRMNSGMPMATTRMPSPYGGSSVRYSSYNRAYASTAYGASMPASVRYQAPISNATSYQTRSYGGSVSGPSRMAAAPSMRYGASSYGGGYGRR